MRPIVHSEGMTNSEWAAFLSVTALLTLTPGADTALVTRNTLARGRRAAFRTTLGISAGCLTHATLSALGLSAILNQSATVYGFVKLAGALYLIYVGMSGLWGAWRPKVTPAAVEAAAQDSSFREGLLTNLLNPKVGIFYLSFLPQFIQPEQNLLLWSVGLATLHNAMGIAWLNFYAALIARAQRSFLGSAGLVRWLEGATGALLTALGIRLAFDDSHR